MLIALALAAAVSAILAMLAENGGQRHPAFYVLKPLTTLLITGIALLGPPGEYRSLVIVALLLSCAGDICLMYAGDTVPERSEVGAGAGDSDASRTHLLTQDTVSASEGDKWFLGGLGSFLLAHIVFVVAYIAGLDRVAPPWWSLLFLVYGIAFFVWLLPRTGKLKIPVIIYGASLMGMAITASARWINLQDSAALMALAGAAIFVVSDSALAVRKFRGAYRHAQTLILSTYWLAIGLIAASAA